MSTTKVMYSPTLQKIIAGKVNSSNLFTSTKEDVTDSALDAVIDYLHSTNQEVHVTIEGVEVKLALTQVN